MKICRTKLANNKKITAINQLAMSFVITYTLALSKGHKQTGH